MLSFKHEVFYEVARNLSLTKASQILYISQPAITKHIQSLEEQYSISLLERRGSLISLTEAGKILMDFIGKAKAIQKQLEFEIHSYQNEYNAKSQLKLGASTTVSLYIVPSILSGFRLKYPNVEISLLNRNAENVTKALLDHEIDLAIIEGKDNMGMLNTEPFLEDEIIPVCSARSRLAQKPNYSVQQLIELPVALRERGSGTLSVVKQALSAHNIKLSALNITMRLGGTEALKNFILADESLGFLSKRAVSRELASGELIQLQIADLKMVRQFHFIQRHGDDNQRLNQAFIKFSKSHYNI